MFSMLSTETKASSTSDCDDIFMDCVSDDSVKAYGGILPDCEDDDFEDLINSHPEPDDDDDCNIPSLSLADELFLFFIVTNIPKRVMQQLLNILLKHGVNVPNSIYKLSKIGKTADFVKSQSIDGGTMGYLSILNNLNFCFVNGLLCINNLRKLAGKFVLSVHINIDGLPLYKSSNCTLWPILLRFEGYSRPLPIAVYCGVGKPDVVLFVHNFLNELHVFKNIGLLLNNGVPIFMDQIVFLCDAPARAHLQCIKGHNGYAGCGYCRQRGSILANRMVFCVQRSELRTDIAYYNFQENNQLLLSPLTSIVPLRAGFPPDYMHLICLGVVQKLFHYYFTATKHMRLSCKSSHLIVNQKSEKINSIKLFVPSDFQRRPRSLSEIAHFKASEYCLYILYLGPMLFKKYFAPKFFNHFCLLHFCVYVLCHDNLHHLYHHAEKGLELFVHQMSELFGEQSVIYNVHVLLHLKEFVDMYGCFDKWSAFPFENYLSF